MNWLDKLKKKKQKMQEQMQRGRIVTEQMKADKLRKKGKRISIYEPGTIRFALIHRQSPSELMEDVKCRRKEKRENRKREQE